MSVKMQPTSEIKAHLGIEPNGRVQRFFTNTCYKKMTRYVPKDEGLLRTITNVKASTITYQSPYASYQYYGVREDGTHKVVNYTTAGTGPYWDKKMWSIHGQDIINETQDYVNRGGA